MARIPPIGKFAVPNPYTISCESTLAEAERKMSTHRIRHLPVTDGKRIYGVLSERDISMAKAVRACKVSAKDIFIKDVCIYDPYVVEESEPIDTVLATMAKRRLGSVIVTKEDDISGIFTTVDACRILAALARGESWEKLTARS